MKFIDSVQQGGAESLGGIDPWGQCMVLVLVLGFLLWTALRLLRKRRGRKACRWRKDGTRAGMTRWRCAVCGVDAFSKGRRSPKECKRALKPVGLLGRRSR
jgi:hypothetical protein